MCHIIYNLCRQIILICCNVVLINFILLHTNLFFTCKLCINMFLGDFGSYQLRQFLLNLMSAFTAGLHMMALVTVAAVPDYKYI